MSPIIVRDYEQLKALSDTDVLLKLYRYWQERRGARPFPGRREIDPVQFSFAIGRVSLIDVIATSPRFHYRLVSTAITDRLGYEMTDKFTEEIRDRATRAYVEDLYDRAVTCRMALFERSTRIFMDRLWQHEALLLPLSSDGDTIDMLMVYRWTYDPEPIDDLTSPAGPR